MRYRWRLLCVRRKVDRRARRGRGARTTHTQVAYWIRRKVARKGGRGRRAKGVALVWSDPYLGQPVGPGYRRAIAISSPDTHPPLNPVLPVKPALLGCTRSPFSGPAQPGADAPWRTACIPPRTSRSSSDNTSPLTDVRSFRGVRCDKSAKIYRTLAAGKLSKLPLLTSNSKYMSRASFCIFIIKFLQGKFLNKSILKYILK